MGSVNSPQGEARWGGNAEAPRVQVREANSMISALPLSYAPEDGGIRTRDP